MLCVFLQQIYAFVVSVCLVQVWDHVHSLDTVTLGVHWSRGGHRRRRGEYDDFFSMSKHSTMKIRVSVCVCDSTMTRSTCDMNLNACEPLPSLGTRIVFVKGGV